MISAKLTRTGGLGKVLDVLRRPYDGVRGRLALRRIRSVITEEFTRGVTFTPGGGAIPMKPTKAFGTRPATVPPLGGASSSLLAAWKGGPGGFQSTGPNRVTLGVSLVYAAVHRGGTDVPSRTPTRIRVTDRQRRFLGAAFGVHLRADTTHIVIPARPHVDARAPQYVEAARGVIVEALSKAGAPA